MLAEVSRRGLMQDTLVIFSSDNGIPFPLGKENPDIREIYASTLTIFLCIKLHLIMISDIEGNLMTDQPVQAGHTPASVCPLS